MMENKTILITGVSGYIGGQTALMLADQGYTVYGVDLQVPSPAIAATLLGFSHSDINDPRFFGMIDTVKPSAIIHCAGTSLVGPSVDNPEVYYHNNFIKTLVLLNHLINSGNKVKFIFSSSAAVYGEPIMVPCSEWDLPMPISPYGESKLMVEMMLKSYNKAYNLDFVAFRYFNACGADSQARHGQAPQGTHIIARVLESIRDQQTFTLYGDSYSTPDGTCQRDYVHVEDIARAHILAIDPAVVPGVYNLGAEKGTSNLEIIQAAERITGKTVSKVTGPMRPGDPAVLTATADSFKQVSGWEPKYELDDMVQHAWAWYTR
jgi:UDP-glucose 4-epimerase